jgi:uncharacterized protein YigE (DUF2233 family)
MQFLNKYYRFCNLCLLSILFWYSNIALALEWETLGPGLDYTTITPIAGLTSGKLNVFRADLKHFQLKLAYTQSYFSFVSNVEELVLQNHAVLGINGGFFGENLKPLGLRINQGKVLNTLKSTSWWGVFYIKGQFAFIDSLKNFRYQEDIDFAIQAGPRLIVDGEIPHLKPGIANRTAIGITRNGKIIIAATSNLSITTEDLAHILRNDLNCISALNLDGGNSTRMFAAINNFRLHVPSITPVSDVILLVPRNK